jgi:putative mRNA 3-end processing factor
MMKIRFFGGAHEVGRSAILIEDERNIMLDYGMKIDHETEFPIGSPKVDLAVVSHAHLDHSGCMPALYNEASIPTFGTRPTLRLAGLLLEDSLKLSHRNHTRLNYHKKQLGTFNSRYVAIDYGSRASFGNYDITLSDAGHISGSAVTLVERMKGRDNRRIVYTGDFKLQPQLLHTGAKIVKGDTLIIESTYATREHPDRQKLIKGFIEGIKETLDNRGTALVPSFAVGRAQELLAILQQGGLAERTYVDGMAREATRIVMAHSAYINNAKLLGDAVNSSTFIDDPGDRKGILDGPAVILTPAGMLNGGPALEYITKLNRNSRIFITGYQVDGTNGRNLVNTGRIDVDGERRKIGIPVSVYDFSAHAGKSDLYKYVRECAPNTVICVHGDPANTEAFAEELKGEGFDAYAPKVGDSIELAG